jgi:hypothetical protein
VADDVRARFGDGEAHVLDQRGRQAERLGERAEHVADDRDVLRSGRK